MSTNATEITPVKIQFGTKLLYRSSESEYKEAIVIRVCAKSFELAETDKGNITKSLGLWKSSIKGDMFWPLKNNRSTDFVAVSDTPENRYSWDWDAAHSYDFHRDKLLERKKREKEIEEQQEKEISETKKAFVAMYGEVPILDVAAANQAIFPNLSLIQLSIPVKPCFFEKKEGWEIILLRAHREKKYNYKTEKEEDSIRYTYVNTYGGMNSFSSAYPSNEKTLEDCLWHAINRCYHSW